VEPTLALADRLREKSAAIVERWLGHALAAYPKVSRRAFQREKDPFANPVGHALRTATRAVLEGLVHGQTAGEIASCLDEVIKIRAVQEFAPSRAIAFVFSLKEAVRAELGKGDSPAALLAELADLDRRIDQIALGAFDIYTRYRGQIAELRISEVKRSLGGIRERTETSPCAEAQRGDAR
jgi:hypothetical protein